MTGRPRFLVAVGALALAGVVALIAYEAGRSSGLDRAARATEPVPPEVTATVRTAPVREGTVTKAVAAYGSVVPAPDGLRSLSVPFECRIDRLEVSEGRAVSKGDVLLVVSGSPDAKLALAQARADAHAAGETLKQVREKRRLELADDAALAQAEAAEKTAGARLASLEARRLDSSHPLASPVTGAVVRLPFPQGAIVPAGVPLLEVAGSRAVEVRLGVEPSAASRLSPGSSVSIRPVDGGEGKPVLGRIESVSPAIDPTTRLVDVYVALPEGTPLALGRYVEGALTVDSQKGLVVPYASVLPGEKGSVLYTVKNGRAVRHEVRVVLEDADRVLVSARGLAAGDEAITLGNYEVEDGMAVRVEHGP